MITLEMDDGSVKKFNLPLDREEKLLQMWTETMNRKICLTTSEGEKIEVKLVEISDCYIGENKKEGFFQDMKQDAKDFLGDSIPDVLKEMLFGKK